MASSESSSYRILRLRLIFQLLPLISKHVTFVIVNKYLELWEDGFLLDILAMVISVEALCYRQTYLLPYNFPFIYFQKSLTS